MREKFTIVVADDDLDDQELIRSGLKDCKVKVNVIPVLDGIRLMDFLTKRFGFKDAETPDLILLDLNMPLMDGFQALAQISKLPAIAKIPLYVITTSRAAKDKAKALELGATGFYSKGASSKEIVGIMKEICRECFEDTPEPQPKL